MDTILFLLFVALVALVLLSLYKLHNGLSSVAMSCDSSNEDLDHVEETPSNPSLVD